MQLTHYNSTFTKKKFPITIVCENVSNAPNIGSLFRICDAFGVEKIIFCGEKIAIPTRKIQKTSRATEKYVSFEIANNIKDVLKTKKETHQLIALEITNQSTPINTTTFNINKPIVIIIGDENFGISDDVLKICNQVIHVTMYGENSSMNVVQATNIVLYEITKQIGN